MKYLSKNVMSDSFSKQPTFDEKKCFDYFRKTYRDDERAQVRYEEPDWLPPASKRVIDSPFNMKEISEEDLKFSLKKKRNKSAPGPDALNYAVWKRCPLTHSYLRKLYNCCITWKCVPSSWKLGVIRLFHKDEKAPTDDPKQFRPICLTNALGKIFSSILLTRLLKYALDNKIINTSIQKGFLQMPGCWEHAFSLDCAIRFSKKTNRRLCGCLIDIANAYGSVKHELILHVLQRYQFPIAFQELIRDWYHNMAAIVSTRDFNTKAFPMEIGVFQGDPLSVGIFLLTINPLMEVLSKPEVAQLGFTIGKNENVKSVSTLLLLLQMTSLSSLVHNNHYKCSWTIFRRL